MSLSVQFQTLLAMIVMGSLFGAMLDTYQRFLNRVNRKRWIVFINDLLFWFIQGILIFYILFLVNSGELRIYLLLALCLGFAAYQALFKQSYERLLEWVIRLVKAAVHIIKKLVHLLIYQPVRGLFLLIKYIVISLLSVGLALVKTVGKVLKWLVTTVFRPILWIGKMIVPKKVEKFVVKMGSSLEGFFQNTKNKVSKIIEFLRRKR
ncbi:spore cortex biosynthesis protein YabQ [Siminovitchia sp. FSL H7-0308]|jgi:spore cortex biosynthesis protein YabQ|uniref:spore cortex biosynthesis protein YabQ n=1 Tax=unclassified Siminovitchia TaxID=2837530 RepID=UPI0030D1DBCA